MKRQYCVNVKRTKARMKVINSQLSNLGMAHNVSTEIDTLNLVLDMLTCATLDLEARKDSLVKYQNKAGCN